MSTFVKDSNLSPHEEEGVEEEEEEGGGGVVTAAAILKQHPQRRLPKKKKDEPFAEYVFLRGAGSFVVVLKKKTEREREGESN